MSTSTKRYFIVFYVASCKKGQVTGHLTIDTNFGYPGCKLLLSKVKNYDPSNPITSPVITNIIELSEADHNHWIEEEETKDN